ncbi:MAG TPA: acyl-CoA dehydrogenase family protein [Blastocatellia bacterium]|nr:acyl-CoA dehydrogenase family protein [Blastocatellia bacterium]
MEFGWSEEQQERYQSIVRFARGELSPGHLERDREARFERKLWEQAADFGLTGLPIPQAWGGLSFDTLDTIRAIEGLGYGCLDTGLIFSICAHLFACAVPIWKAGDDRQRERFLKPATSGQLIAANAMTEPEAGSDISSLKTSALKDGDHYVLNGVKSFVTNGPVADLFLVYATVSRQAGFLGLTAFLIEKDTPRLKVAPIHDKVGLRSSPIAEVYLDDCRVPAENRLGREGAGGAIFKESMGWERTCLFAVYVGLLQRQLEICIERTRDRKQFGQPIGKFQSVANRIVDMKLRLEASRLLLYQAGWVHQHRPQSDLESALSKLFIAESAVQSGLDAIQIYGGYGCLSEMGIDLMLRDAIPARIYSGTSEVMRKIIANSMGL